MCFLFKDVAGPVIKKRGSAGIIAAPDEVPYFKLLRHNNFSAPQHAQNINLHAANTRAMKERCIHRLALLCFCFAAMQSISAQTKPVIFEPGKISTAAANRDMAISADGNELFYTIQFSQGLFSVIMHSVKKNGVWGELEVASFSGKHSDLEPFFEPGGDRLYFSSNRALTDTGADKDFDIWYVTKVNGVWQNPKNIGAPVNTPNDEFYISVAKSGNMYFTSGTDNRSDDIKVCRYVNGKYEAPVSLSDSVNSAGYEFNAFVDPDEQFMLYTAHRRPEGFGRGDLYISRKAATGEWGKGVNLFKLNSPYMDYCPFVTADKKYLYFTSDRPTYDAPFKIPQDAKAIKAMVNNAGNGQDDIYVVPFSEVVP